MSDLQSEESLPSFDQMEQDYPQQSQDNAEDHVTKFSTTPKAEDFAEKAALRNGGLCSNSIPKASLLGLPTELLDKIVAYCQTHRVTQESEPLLSYTFITDWSSEDLSGYIDGPNIPPLAQTSRRLRHLYFNMMFKNSKVYILHDSPTTSVEFFSSLSFTDLNAIKLVSIRYDKGLLRFDYPSFSKLCKIFGSMGSLESLHITMPLCAQLYEDRRPELHWNNSAPSYITSEQEFILPPRTTEEQELLWWNTRCRPWIRDLFTIQSPGSAERLTEFVVTSDEWKGSENDVEDWIRLVLAEDWESRKARLERMDEYGEREWLAFMEDCE